MRIPLTLSFLLAAAGNVTAGAPPEEHPVLHDIAGSVSAKRIEADITRLVSFGTRHTLSRTESDERGIGAARRWIEAEFRRISEDCGGCLEVVVQSDTISGEERIPEPTEVVNVLGILRGKSDPNRYIVMSGDIDSRVSDVMDAESDAPGANDNASGVAGVLEAARVLTHQRPFSATIVFAALSGEEQGLFGGQIMARRAVKDGWRVEAVLNNDMIGNIHGINGIANNTTARIFSQYKKQTLTDEQERLMRYTGGEVDSPSRNLARYIDRLADQYIRNLDTQLVYRLDRYRRGGHHTPFNNVGYPGVRIMETNENYNQQHQDLRTEDGIDYGDRLEYVEFDYAAKLTALNAVTLASLAWAPPPPAGVEIEGAVSPDTTLSWKRPPSDIAPALAGFNVHWRPTAAPQWTKRHWAGDVETHTLENVVIDNYLFGVSSVSENGFESPVVFPGPIGSFGGYDAGNGVLEDGE